MFHDLIAASASETAVRRRSDLFLRVVCLLSLLITLYLEIKHRLPRPAAGPLLIAHGCPRSRRVICSSAGPISLGEGGWGHLWNKDARRTPCSRTRDRLGLGSSQPRTHLKTFTDERFGDLTGTKSIVGALYTLTLII